MIRTRAFAKINLSLEITGVRPDGYHSLRTVFQSVALHDTLTFSAASPAFRIRCTDPACPPDETNLVWRAAERVWAASGRRGAMPGVAVRIAKRIPMQAGLGGGSSDAAAAIRGLTTLWRVRLTRDRATRIASALGADVPFFLEGGTVRGAGRGDRLLRLPDAPPAWVVLVVPPLGVSTREAYGWWDHERGQTPFSRSVDAKKGSDPNHLQSVVAAHHPEIAELVTALRQQGARAAAMSGSGSAVFGLFDRRGGAQ